MKKALTILISTLAIFASACATNTSLIDEDTSAKKDTVYVSILPQKFFVEQIAGDTVNVEVMVKPGFSPATYEPTTQQMLLLSDAQIYFRIGVPFEETWIDKIAEANPNMKIIDTREGISLREIDSIESIMHEEEEGEEHDHEEEYSADHHEEEEEHDHDHSGKDPHIWLSPNLVKIQAATIKDALAELKPENNDFYTENLSKFENELFTLHQDIDSQLALLDTKEFLVFHPSWGYFADEFSLKQYAIEVEGKEPTIAELAEIIDLAKEKNIKVIFVQKQFSEEVASSVAEQLDAFIVELDPLAEDYIENLRAVPQLFETN